MPVNISMSVTIPNSVLRFRNRNVCQSAIQKFVPMCSSGRSVRSVTIENVSRDRRSDIQNATDALKDSMVRTFGTEHHVTGRNLMFRVADCDRLCRCGLGQRFCNLVEKLALTVSTSSGRPNTLGSCSMKWHRYVTEATHNWTCEAEEGRPISRLVSVGLSPE